MGNITNIFVIINIYNSQCTMSQRTLSNQFCVVAALVSCKRHNMFFTVVGSMYCVLFYTTVYFIISAMYCVLYRASPMYCVLYSNYYVLCTIYYLPCTVYYIVTSMYCVLFSVTLYLDIQLTSTKLNHIYIIWSLTPWIINIPGHTQ